MRKNGRTLICDMAWELLSCINGNRSWQGVNGLRSQATQRILGGEWAVLALYTIEFRISRNPAWIFSYAVSLILMCGVHFL
jgi:hypothetical protein